ncbi:MAG TPA: ankyrin repeat domain-containing protein, partial [Terriglobia bacterium]|nr:ankyrin repeat domain-containing protein [Terriglobia bacterium]
AGGFTALLFAAQQGDVESARILLEAGADVNEGTQEDGTALVIATASGHEAMARFLLERGADPNARDAFGITPLHYAMNKGLTALAGAKRSATDRFGWLRPTMPELAKALLAKGADPNARIARDFPPYDYAPIARANGNDHAQLDLVGVTPFILAAASGDVTSMRILVEGGADPRRKTDEGVSALLVAAGLGIERGMLDEQSALEAARLAVQLGADVNAAKEDGRTALHVAALLGWNDMIQFLAEQGANLNAKDMYGQTPLSIALGDPEGLIYRQLPGGRYDDRFRNPREQKATAELLLKLGAAPFTGKYRDRSGE